MSESQETAKIKASSKILFNTSMVTHDNDQNRYNCDYSYEQDSSVKNKKNDFVGKKKFLPMNTPFNYSVNGTNSHFINNKTNKHLPFTVLNNERKNLLSNPSNEEIKILTIILTTMKTPLGEVTTINHLQYDTKLVSKLSNNILNRK